MYIYIYIIFIIIIIILIISIVIVIIQLYNITILLHIYYYIVFISFLCHTLPRLKKSSSYLRTSIPNAAHFSKRPIHLCHGAATGDIGDGIGV